MIISTVCCVSELAALGTCSVHASLAKVRLCEIHSDYHHDVLKSLDNFGTFYATV